MVKQVEIVVGANFGDEGKGLMTDFFCDKFSKQGSVLNVRHNGGAQAGHTVCTPDGMRHVFSHFGAGSFVSHVATYLSGDFILNPILFCRELDALSTNYGITPKVYVNPKCRITTPYEMLINQIVERSRGDKRHGSCGLGINETVVRHELNPLYFGSLAENPVLINHLVPYLMLMRKGYVPVRLHQLGVYEISELDRRYLESDTIIENWLFQLSKMLDYCVIANDDIINQYDSVVFEGAQGLLLDNDFVQFAPNLTSSKTGSVNPKNILCNLNLLDCHTEVCYVTRSYFTRHGAGRFPTECRKEEMFTKGILDLTNHYNEFQGNFRYGYFDRQLFESVVGQDILYRDSDFSNIRYTRAITHLDETDGKILYPDKMGSDFPYEVNYRSYGETRDDIEMVSDYIGGSR